MPNMGGETQLQYEKCLSKHCLLRTVCGILG